MAETDTHRNQMVDLIDALKLHFESRDDIYVSGNLLVFYEPGNKHKHVSPDVFVVFGVAPGDRPNFLIWEEHAVPAVVIELTSKSTRREDLVEKKAVYLSLGVQEYYLYDPTGQYLHPPLRGWHAAAGEWVRVHDASVHSPALALDVRVVADHLRLVDPATGEVLPTRAEAERRRADEERRGREAAEEEVRRLRDLLDGRR